VGLRETFEDWVKVLKLATKPTKEEYMLTLKTVLLGLGLLGSIGFAFQLVGSMLEFASFTAIPREYMVVGGVLVALVLVLVTMYLRGRSKL
jgi:protein translocase SEC61 complex gamma subunit